MLRLLATSLIVAGSTAVAASVPVTPAFDAVETQLRDARSEVRQAIAEQQRLEAAAEQAKDEVVKLRARQLAAAKAIAVTESRISEAQARARLAAAQLEVQKRQLARAQAPLSNLLAGLVLASRRPPLLLLADSGSGTEMVKLKILVSATEPAIRSRTMALSDHLEKSRALERSALAARDDIVGQRSELEGRRAALEALERTAVRMAKMRGSEALSAGDSALASNERFSTISESAAAARRSASTAAELAAIGPAPLPSAGTPSQPAFAYRLPSRARVADGLGAVSNNGIRSRGITLATKKGARLTVPADGTIVFSGPYEDYDGVIIIDHGSGWKSVLVNAATRLPKGEKVKIGKPLGIALGPVEIQVHQGGETRSPALIAGSSVILSNRPEGG